MSAVEIMGLVGGSGAGKSTLAQTIFQKYPDQVSVLHFDDYQKLPDAIPLDEATGMRNWDCPEAIDFDRLLHDLRQLKQGVSVSVSTKDRYLNPAYAQTKQRIAATIYPKRLVILEGYLVLYKAEVRDLLDFSIFLDLDHETRMRRRDKFLSPSYESEILAPMHLQFVLPTRRFTDLLISVADKSFEQVFEEVMKFIQLKNVFC